MSDNSRKIELPEGQLMEARGKPFKSEIIPDSFWLGGLQIDVVIDENLLKSRKLLGEAQYPAQRIVLDSGLLKQQLSEQNYYHELVHWILYVMNEDVLRDNEKFVDVFATFLHQARVTEQRSAVSANETDDTEQQRVQFS